MTKNTTPEAQSERACLCGAFELEIGHDAETMQYADTGCTATTTRDFAPGHDAKLKSLLIRAGVQGHSVRYNQGGVAYISSAEDAAAKLPFGYMILDGIKRGQEKAAAKADKPKRARKAKDTGGTDVPHRIKVGRWEYDGTVDSKTGVASYTSKGELKTAAPGKFKIVGIDTK